MYIYVHACVCCVCGWVGVCCFVLCMSVSVCVCFVLCGVCVAFWCIAPCCVVMCCVCLCCPALVCIASTFDTSGRLLPHKKNACFRPRPVLRRGRAACRLRHSMGPGFPLLHLHPRCQRVLYGHGLTSLGCDPRCLLGYLCPDPYAIDPGLLGNGKVFQSNK